jgi:hypothetical protein
MEQHGFDVPIDYRGHHTHTHTPTHTHTHTHTHSHTHAHTHMRLFLQYLMMHCSTGKLDLSMKYQGPVL